MKKANKKLVPDPICVEICVNDRPVALMIGKASLNVSNLCAFLMETPLEDVLSFYEIDKNLVEKYVDFIMHSDFVDPSVCIHEFREKGKTS